MEEGAAAAPAVAAAAEPPIETPPGGQAPVAVGEAQIEVKFVIVPDV